MTGGSAGRTLTPAELRQRGEAGLVHGAKSEARVKAKARARKRAFLRRARLRATDLDVVTLSLLDHYCRGAAVLDLRDEAGADASKDYWVSYNAVKRCLDSLAARLRELGIDTGGRRGDPLAELAAAGRAIAEARNARSNGDARGE